MSICVVNDLTRERDRDPVREQRTLPTEEPTPVSASRRELLMLLHADFALFSATHRHAPWKPADA